MTTNQTIDGVPRELLENAARCIERYQFGTDWAKELRALLDAPAVQCLAMEVNGKPWVIKEGPNADKWRAMGYELFPVEPAAHPQGDPVAWDVRGFHDGTLQAKSLHYDKESALRFSNALLNRGGYHEVKMIRLYAEQPAPVAAVMP